MHAIDFLRNPATVPARPVYALHGDDAYLRSEALRAIARGALQAAVYTPPLSEYYLEAAPRVGLLLGYTGVDDAEIDAGVRRLATALGPGRDAA